MGKWLSRIALFFAFVLPPIGLVLGIIGINQASNPQEDRKSLAIGAIIIGAIGSLWILSLIL